MNFLKLGWMGSDRVRAYGWILFITAPVSTWFKWTQAMGEHGSDFQAFWSAATLAIRGTPAAAYELAAMAAVAKEISRPELFAFVNPPPFLLPIAPLGWLPYPYAWWVWTAGSFALWLAVSRRFVPGFTGAVAGFPGALVAAWHAQTGLFMSALQAGAAVLLRTRPFLAGCCVGALVMKPHLAVLFPIAFLAARQWRAIAGAAFSSLGLLALAWAVFGTETMLAYPSSWKFSRLLMVISQSDFYLKQCTVYAAFWVIAGPKVAAVVQAIATVLVSAVVWCTWRSDWTIEAKLALLFAATPLATPYLFSYDLPFLILPVLWLANEVKQNPRGGWERLELMAFYLAPLATRAVAWPIGANLMPWISLWLMSVIMRRADSSAARVADQSCRNAT